MIKVSAAQFPEVYENLGIDTGRLGCIMLDTDPIKVHHIIPEDALYYADPEEHEHLQGIVSESVPHCTLLYGLMRSGPEMKKHVDAVLTGWEPGSLIIDKVDFFFSDKPGENYITVIALIRVTDNLLEGNARLGFLPHLNTFVDYRPHITLAYCKDNSSYNDFISKLNKELAGKAINVLGINYGD